MLSNLCQNNNDLMGNTLFLAGIQEIEKVPLYHNGSRMSGGHSCRLHTTIQGINDVVKKNVSGLLIEMRQVLKAMADAIAIYWFWKFRKKPFSNARKSLDHKSDDDNTCCIELLLDNNSNIKQL